jgi:hypothetical protein
MNFILSLLGSKLGIGALVSIGALIALWAYGVKKEREGYNACKVEWVEAERTAIERAEKARDDAESHVDSATDGKLHDDPNNRDNN